MNPRELTAMLELVSGSEAYRAEYDRLQGEQKEAEAKLRACFSNKKVRVVHFCRQLAGSYAMTHQGSVCQLDPSAGMSDEPCKPAPR